MKRLYGRILCLLGLHDWDMNGHTFNEHGVNVHGMCRVCNKYTIVHVSFEDWYHAVTDDSNESHSA
jgi:hypothetical protein